MWGVIFYRFIEPASVGMLGISLIMVLGCLMKVAAEVQKGPALEHFENLHSTLSPISQLLKIVVTYPSILTDRGKKLRKILYGWATTFALVFVIYGAITFTLYINHA